MKFKHFTNKEGLSINTVQCITQDNKGYIWIGTINGLNKFDGNNFTEYIYASYDSLSISNNIIWSIFQDKSGQIWIGTEEGLNKYNLDTDTFERFLHKANDSTSLSNSLVKDILETKDGRIWVATYCGTLSVYNKETNNFTNHKVTFNGERFLNERINSLDEDDSGNIWMGTEGGGLYCYNPQTKEIDSYRHKEFDSRSLGHDIVKTVFVDSKNNLWIGTSSGLNRFISKTEGFYRYQHDNKRTNSINPGIVDAIFEDSFGKIWIGIDGGGLNLLDSNDAFIHYLNNSQDVNSLSSNIVRSIYEDKTGNLWVGTYNGGLNLHNKLTAPFQSYFHNDLDPYSLSNSSVLSFLEDSEGDFWVGTDGGGLNLFDASKNQFHSFQHRENDPNSLSSNAILCMYQDKSGQIWIGTFNGGLNKFNKKNGTFTTFTTDFSNHLSLANPHVWSIFEDSRQNLWVGTMGGGLNLMDRKTGTFKRFLFDENNPNSISSFLVWHIFEDSKGRLWIGTHNGLNLFDYQTQTFKAYKNNVKDPKSLSNNWVLNIYEDKNSNLWICTYGGGLNRFDPENGTFVAYTTENGLPSNVILGVLEDNSGNLWLSTKGGISKFNPTTNVIQNFDESYGLRSNELNIGAFHKNTKGIMLVGSTAGYTMFNPDEVMVNQELPRIVLTDLYVLNKKIGIGGEPARLNKHISEATEIYLEHNDYSFSISYAALNYFATDKYSYSYKLEGFDKTWNDVGNMRTAIYTNIDPGKYTFKVRAANDAGKWETSGASISIIIAPPFWGTWWFRVVLIISFIAVLYAIYMIKVSDIQRNKRQLEKEVKDRTNDLQESNALLEELNQEVNQQKEELITQAEILARTNQELAKSADELELHKNNLEELVKIRTAELEKSKEKAVESDQLKSAFLANMSHEIRTPMNAIVGFSNLLYQPDIDVETRCNYIKQINSNTRTLLTLIDDILDISMIESNQLHLNKTEFELNLLLDEVFIESTLRKAKIEIRLLNHISDSNVVLFTDRIRLKQILDNLLNNACKFTEEGFVELGCYLKDNELIIFVKDTGIGISAEDLGVIFDRFRKVSDDKTKLFRGVGLGLAISKKIGELLGGQLTCESEFGVGSTFSLALPTHIMVNKGVPKQTQIVNSGSVFNWEFKNILIVEDEEANYLYLESALKKTKANVTWAKNGSTAVSLFSSGQQFDVVLMDIKMPILNGYEATTTIKALFPDQIIIAQTAYARPEEILQIKNSGFDDYLIKPIIPNHLYSVVSKYI